MSFLNNFRINSNKITEEKTNLETVISLFFYFLLALSYYVKKNFKNNYLIGLVAVSYLLYWYFSRKSEQIDGMEVPSIGDNFDLSLD
jgi:uncharacterized membrane protein